MSQTVWIVGGGRVDPLASGLLEAGITVRQGGAALIGEAVVGAYDGQGLLLLDAATEGGSEALGSADVALLPVLAIADDEVALPAGVMRLPSSLDGTGRLHHVREVLAGPRNLRRHPRVPVDLPARVGPRETRTVDASLYGVRVVPGGALGVGEAVELAVVVGEGAEALLEGRVVAVRDGAAAIRCRPRRDQDLLLWIHLLLEGLEHSPLHGDGDPFAALFEEGEHDGAGRPND
jgi:hypothetical protein